MFPLLQSDTKRFSGVTQLACQQTSFYIILLLQAREQPTTQAQVIEYLLSTETGEMQYETARCRPQLNDSFFAYLDSQIGESDVHCTEQEKVKVCLMHHKHT